LTFLSQRRSKLVLANAPMVVYSAGNRDKRLPGNVAGGAEVNF